MLKVLPQVIAITKNTPRSPFHDTDHDVAIVLLAKQAVRAKYEKYFAGEEMMR